MKHVGRTIISAWKIILTVLFSIVLLSSMQQSRIPSLPFPPLGISPITDLLDRVSSAARATNNLTNQPFFHGIAPWQFDRLASRVTQLESSLTSLSRTVQQKPALRRVNFFAAGSGVIIDPYLTSPTRILRYSEAAQITAPRSYMDLLRGRSSHLLPRTGPGPAAVFTAWDDAGECWCSAQGGGRAQVAMLLPQLVVPQQLVVEHIPESATLDASSMPRAVELWVQVDDPAARARVARAAREVVPDHHAVPDADPSPPPPPSQTWERQGATAMTRSELAGDGKIGNKDNAATVAATAERAKIEFATSRALDESWIRVGRWPFDRTSAEAAQAFDVPVRLDQLAVPVSHVAVRVTASWGDGHDANVCIYRLRLHGLVASELPMQRR